MNESKTGGTTKKKKTSRSKKGTGNPPKPKQVSNTNKPEGMTDKEWQTILRRQIAEKEQFVIENIGAERIYSDYQVFNPHSKNTYKVALRSKENTLNFCNCPDFKTNLLGTCKHIEAVRIKLSKQRGIKTLLNIIPQNSYSSLYVSYIEDRVIKLRIGTADTEAYKKWSKKYFNSDYVLLPAAFYDIEKLIQEAHQINSSFRCYPDALDLIIGKRTENGRHALINKKGATLLKGLAKVQLFPYQAEGVLFAAKAGRSILADDMGLGKTIQAITCAMLLKQHFKTTKALIVCPTSLKYQWKTEIEKFTDSSVCVVEGNVLTRRAIYKNDESYFRIVSYHVAGNDWQYINEMAPDIIILDEAQRIKNWRAKISQNIKRLRSPYALILTGTPVENNIEELYSLVQYIDPFLLGSLHHFLSGHQVKDAVGKVIGYQGLNGIGEQLSGIMLRRRKKDVLKQLPARMDKNLFVPLTDQQRDLHTEYTDQVARLIYKWRRFGFLTEKERQSLLNLLNLMRMVCDTTFIIDQKTNFQTKLDELFNILDELLLDPDEKVVVFSQWERMTRLIAAGLEERNIRFENLHGSIPSKDRAKLFSNFNNDPECRVFLSTDAGGVGLNLQAASNLINMDIPWNPAVLEQRIGRIYRMGQKKNVSITNIIAQDTIEHGMLAKLKFKSAVAEGILDFGDDSIFAGDDKFKKFIEMVESITEDSKVDALAFDEGEKEAIAQVDHEDQQDPNLLPLEDTAAEDLDQEQQLGAGITDRSRIPDPADLIRNGMGFISQLMKTLNDPEATKALTKGLTEQDEKTGQTYLKIPIENTDVVEQALGFFSKLFRS